MTQRILIAANPATFKVSKQGFNVFSATPEQTLFDASLDSGAGIYRTGSYSNPNAGMSLLSSSVGQWNYILKIPLGKTFSAPPPNVWSFVDNYSNPSIRGNSAFNNTFFNGSSLSGSTYRFYADTDINYFNFYMIIGNANVRVTLPDLVYAIFQG